jgi:hypothetical protein
MIFWPATVSIPLNELSLSVGEVGVYHPPQVQSQIPRTKKDDEDDLLSATGEHNTTLLWYDTILIYHTLYFHSNQTFPK